MNPTSQSPSPIRFFDIINGFQRTACMKGALDLELFTAIAEGNSTPAQIAARCGASERGIRILCDYLTVEGFLSKNGNSYALTQDTAIFLNRRSPAYMGGVVDFLLSPTIRKAFEDVAACVRNGGTVLSEHGSMEPENPVWVQFARAMAPMQSMTAQALAGHINKGSGRMKVLDIAAGHGLFGIEIAKQNPNAEIVALDWDSVLDVAREQAKAAGVTARYSTIAGSAFEKDFGTGYDAVLLTNFLHHFDPSTCESLLKKVYAALTPGGRAITLDFVPNEDRISPAVPAQFSMTMLTSTRSGDAYTFSEFKKMFGNSGFNRTEIAPLPPTFFSAITSYK